jgi:hypothetical protein
MCFNYLIVRLKYVNFSAESDRDSFCKQNAQINIADLIKRW